MMKFNNLTHAIGSACLVCLLATKVQAAPKPVVFVGNNWDGTVNVFDSNNYAKVGVINVVPDKSQRMS